MNDNYDYSIQVIGESAKELQESFFDVYFRQVGSLSYLLGQMEMLSENDKKKFSPLAQRQSDRLNRAMEQFNSLVNTLKAIDVDGKRIETLSFNIAQKMSAKTMAKKAVPVKKKEEVAEVQTEPVTEAATEAVAEVQTEPVTEAATEAVAEVQTEPVTEAVTEAVAEVQTEPVTEAATEAVAEVQTEPVTEAVAEEPVLIPSVNPELIPVEEKTEPKELIEDTPEAANAAMFDRFKSLPGMENLKLNENGQPDFSSILPPDIKSKFKGSSLSELTSFIAKYQREQMGVAPSTEPAVQLPVIGGVEESTEATTEAVAEVQTEPSTEVVEEVANQLIIPTVAPPAAPVTSPATEVVAEATVDAVITTDAINDVIIPAVDAVSDNATSVDASAEQVLIPAVNSELIPVGESTEVASETPTEVVSEPSTEVVLENNLGESGLRKFIDNTTVPRAILVSEAQFDKLGNSRVSQEALLKFKRILPDVKAGSGESVVAVDMSDLSDADKSKTIEAMMADANNLYTSGKIEEAQAMYDKISELNKSLVKE